MINHSKIIEAIRRKIGNLIKRTTVYAVSDDSETVPTTDITYFDRVKTAHRLSVYGVDSNPPRNCLCVGFNVRGNESDETVIPQDVVRRKKDLKEGEVVYHNTVSDQYIFFKENGDIEIFGPANRIATIIEDDTITIGGNASINVTGNVDITVGGNMTATVGGSAELTASTVDINATTINLTGIVNVNGAFSVTGSNTSSLTGATTIASATINGRSFINHTHSQGNDSDGNAEVETNGVS